MLTGQSRCSEAQSLSLPSCSGQSVGLINSYAVEVQLNGVGTVAGSDDLTSVIRADNGSGSSGGLQLSDVNNILLTLGIIAVRNSPSSNAASQGVCDSLDLVTDQTPGASF